MARKALILLALCWLFPTQRVPAQIATTLAELQISFWPEYDRPAMLVIYRGTVALGTPLPVSLQIQIPARYGPPIAVAFIDPNGQLFDLDYTTIISGDSLTIAFDAPTDKFQLEYYDASLDLNASTRRYSFATLAPYPIERLELQLQHPPGATEVNLEPAFGERTLGADGLTYSETTLANVAGNTPINLELTYIKTDDTFTSNLPSVVVTPDVPQQLNSPAVEPLLPMWIALGVLAVMMVGGGFAMFLRSRSQPTERHAPARRAKPKGGPPRPKEVRPHLTRSGISATTDRLHLQSERAAFCHKCGQPSQPGDRFCRKCGTELRVEV